MIYVTDYYDESFLFTDEESKTLHQFAGEIWVPKESAEGAMPFYRISGPARDRAVKRGAVFVGIEVFSELRTQAVERFRDRLSSQRGRHRPL